MMRLAEIEAHIGNMRELLDIVGAMRSLASMRVQEAERALPAISRYAGVVEGAIGAALMLAGEPLPAPLGRGRCAVVVCCAEHGFVGGFNERLLDAAECRLGQGDRLFILGSRGSALAEERGRPADWAYSMASRPDGVPETVRRLSEELYSRIAGGGIGRIEIVFARNSPGVAATIERRTLFPLDLAALTARRPQQAPLHNLPPAELLERLVADYVFALLAEAAIESLASENAARFAAMAAAHDNVGKKLDELRQEAREARQDEITTELLDLVTGAEAAGASEVSAPRARPP